MSFNSRNDHKLRFYDMSLSEDNQTHNEIWIDCYMSIIINPNNISFNLKWIPSEKIKDSPIPLERNRTNPFSKYDGNYVDFMYGFNFNKNKITTGLLENLLMTDDQILFNENIFEKKNNISKFAQQYRENIIFSLIQWSI